MLLKVKLQNRNSAITIYNILTTPTSTNSMRNHNEITKKEWKPSHIFSLFGNEVLLLHNLRLVINMNF